MAIRHVLDNVLNHALKARILRILCKRDIGWTGRMLSRELKVSPTTANKFLKALVRNGIVIMKNAGRSYLYSVDPDNYAVKTLLKPFFKKEEDVFDEMLSLIKRSLSKCKSEIRSAAIFGSIAKEEDSYKSDIDLIVIIKDPEYKKMVERSLDDIAGTMARKFQTVIFPYIVTDSRFRMKCAAKDALAAEITKSYILVYGEPLERIII